MFSVRKYLGIFGHPVLALNLFVAMFAFLGLIALGQWLSPHDATQMDEYYFSACTVREMHGGNFPLLSCYDNKAPLIFQLYRQIFAVTSPYDMGAVRLLAGISSLFYAAIFSLAALRFSGWTAAIITASLALSGLSIEPQFLALKTDLVGDIFVAIGLLILCRQHSFQSLRRLFGAGLFFGLAVMTKQTFAFTGFAVIIWLLLCETRFSVTSFAQFITRALAFGSGILIPFVGFVALYALQDKTGQFFQEVFLFPSIYGAGRSLTVVELGRRALEAMQLLQHNFLLFICFSVAAFTLTLQSRRVEIGPVSRFSDPRWLILFVVLGLVSAWVPTGNLMDYYMVSVIGPMALLSGIIVGDHWRNISRSAPGAVVVFSLTALLAQGTMILDAVKNRVWRQEIISAHDKATLAALKLQTNGNAYAYVFGWEAPYVYILGNFIPASDILYPWAFSEQPKKWGFDNAYHMPQAGDRRLDELQNIQKNNQNKLFAQFEKTPPRYLFVYDKLDLQLRSGTREALPGLRSYIADKCMKSGNLAGPPVFVIYACNSKPQATS